MATGTRAAKRKTNLKAGRPPLSSAKASTGNSSSKHTRTLINRHHHLHKLLATARSNNDASQIHAMEAQLEAQGGLEAYQLASRTGQSNDRGGDSSRVLVEWLKKEIEARKLSLHGATDNADIETEEAKPRPLRILEVGALSTQNALNIPGITHVRRIDLHSSATGIEEIDFMDLPLPGEAPLTLAGGNDSDYDILSLSLVLNYVPDPRARGAMLKRTTKFFVQPGETAGSSLPCLFLVLPLPCVNNSRYLTGKHLTSIMQSLSYTNLHMKTTRKLHYSLWHYDGQRGNNGKQGVFGKKELVKGGGRNNFCIMLDTR